MTNAAPYAQTTALANTALTKKVRISQLRQLKGTRPFACLTAYDATFALAASQAGAEVILVGDSLGNVVQGRGTTVPVTMEHMHYHTECVARAQPHSLIMADMPFGSFNTLDAGVDNATALMQAGAEMVKFEYNDEVPAIVKRLRQLGVPSCVHLGLEPQQVFMNGYKVCGKQSSDAERLHERVNTAVEAGAEIILLECVLAPLAQSITESIPVPVIGIGAGADTDGQILVCYDMLGLNQRLPRFVKNYMTTANNIGEAMSHYVAEVQSRDFPTEAHCY